VLAFVFLAAAPQEARAQGFISPFIGFDFGGDSGCQTAGDCEDKNSNIGVAIGSLGSIVGGEFELGYARDFFGEIPDGSSNVLTLMANFVVGPRIGAVRPYLLGGVGLFKTHVELSATDLLESDHNSFGYDLGGGVIILFGERIGVRGDLRRFSTFQERSILGFDISNERLSFQRAAAGLVIAF
jgi:opacity protein-like surface antigen